MGDIFLISYFLQGIANSYVIRQKQMILKSLSVEAGNICE